MSIKVALWSSIFQRSLVLMGTPKYKVTTKANGTLPISSVCLRILSKLIPERVHFSARERDLDLGFFVLRHGPAAWNSNRSEYTPQSNHRLCHRLGEFFSSSMCGDPGHRFINCSNSRRTNRRSDPMGKARWTTLLSWRSSNLHCYSSRSIVIFVSFSGIRNVWSIRTVHFLSTFVKHFSITFVTIKPKSPFIRVKSSCMVSSLSWSVHTHPRA